MQAIILGTGFYYLNKVHDDDISAKLEYGLSGFDRTLGEILQN